MISIRIEVVIERLVVSSPEQPCADNGLSSDQLAIRLDAMGWTKLFCDARPTLPSLPIPSLSLWPWSNSSRSSENAPPSDTATPEERTTTFTSAELWDRYATFSRRPPIPRFHVPLGHTILVANAKNPLYARLCAAGQPLMDQLAAEIVRKLVRLTPSPESPLRPEEREPAARTE